MNFERMDLTGRNTFRMRVSCERFVEYNSVEELRQIDFVALPQPLFHIGGGSNVLFTRDFPGTVLHSCIREFHVHPSSGDEVLVEVGSGITFDDFCAWAADQELWGAENLSGIPGEVGASAVQNIGAYGTEVSEIISTVRCFDIVSREEVSFSASECTYGYRDSMFKHAPAKGRYIVVSVLFRLSRTAGANLRYERLAAELGSDNALTPSKVRAAVLRIRDGKLPDPAETGSAGSFFKNPVVSAEDADRVRGIAAAEGLGEVPAYPAPDGVKLSAAWMIDRCGLKGLRRGGAAVYERQPLVIVNLSGDATPQDVLAVESAVIEAVENKFGIRLSPEVEHL